MKRNDLISIGLLFLIALLIFYPLFSASYVYTDEVLQLWLYRPGSGFSMFVPQGRYLTNQLFTLLFNAITTIDEVRYLRLFSFTGWLVCIPVWYYVFKKVLQREGLPVIFAFLGVGYLITMPSFSVSVQWASCMELFIANTAGLIAGYWLYVGIITKDRGFRVSGIAMIGAVIAGCISLFTYQNGFGCFLLPFLLHVLGSGKLSRKWWIGVAFYLFIYIVYYFLLKYNLKVLGVSLSDRTEFSTSIVNKLLFFLSKPMSTAFQFTWLMNETGKLKYIVYGLLLVLWALMMLWKQPRTALPGRLWWIVCLLGIALLAYIPSLLVKENYASNRTLPAIRMVVFFMVAIPLAQRFRNKIPVKWVVIVTVLLFANAWYNFNYLFLKPVKQEYQLVRSAIEQGWKPGIDTICFTRPPENLFEKKLGITRAWDEFGVPSTFFEWVPEFMVKQIIFEKTGSRTTADSTVVKNWPYKNAFVQ